jgi:hypothetical protein
LCRSRGEEGKGVGGWRWGGRALELWGMGGRARVFGDGDRMLETEVDMVMEMGKLRKREWKDFVVGCREGGRCENRIRRGQCAMYSRTMSTTNIHNANQHYLERVPHYCNMRNYLPVPTSGINTPSPPLWRHPPPPPTPNQSHFSTSPSRPNRSTPYPPKSSVHASHS